MAAVDYFLKIDGIPGESQDAKHKNEIQLESWSFGESNTGTLAVGGGGGAGKVQMQDFHFVKKVDKAGPKLFLACAQGEHITAPVILTCRKAGKDQQEYMKVTFTDVLVSSYNTSGSGGSDIVPLEQISLNFAKIKFEYKEQKADGTLGGSTVAEFNLKTMQAV
jgi:type VI secretion system secreted protein Hcp